MARINRPIHSLRAATLCGMKTRSPAWTARRPGLATDQSARLSSAERPGGLWYSPPTLATKPSSDSLRVATTYTRSGSGKLEGALAAIGSANESTRGRKYLGRLQMRLDTFTGSLATALVLGLTLAAIAVALLLEYDAKQKARRVSAAAGP